MNQNEGTGSPARGKAKCRRVERWAIVLLLAIGCSKALPGEGTPEAQLYRERCGNCHSPAAPASMPYATWEMILPRMEQRISSSGQPPLTAGERQTIEAYLKKHAP